MKKDRRDFFAEKKREKKRKKWGKKEWIIFSSVVAFCLVAVIVGLCLYFFVFKKDENYIREYRSASSFTKATCELVLSDNVSIYEYDAVSDVFVTESSYIDGATRQGVVLYGLADRKKEYTRPYFTSVLSIKGDYAIVARSGADYYADGTSYVGLIKFRGEGTENGIVNVSDFSIEYNSANPEQFYFCGDYLCIMGDKESPSSEATYSTFYDYSSHNQLLECFRLRCGYDVVSGKNYTVRQYENYLVAYTENEAYFFDIEEDRFGGYLELSESGAYSSPYTSTEYTVGLSVLYMGNGWFVRYAYQTSTSPFSGYKLCYQTLDVSGGSSLIFARTTTDFYNVRTGVTKKIPQIFSILEVANAYTSADFLITANSYNNSLTAPDDYPCMNPADMIADGYSILYYFYQPYVGRTDLSDTERSLGKETYCVLDKNMNVVMPETLFPIVTVDGVGFETADPYFDISFGDAVIYTKEGKKTVIPADSSTGYAVVGSHDGCVTIAGLDLAALRKEDSEEVEEMKYGAAGADGKVIVDCTYDKLSAFYGRYAIGAKIVGDRVDYYRIDRSGAETYIGDVYVLKDGIYVFEKGEKYGVKNFDGDVLIEAKFDSIGTSDNYMIDGVYQRTIVIATAGVKTYVYTLE